MKLSFSIMITFCKISQLLAVATFILLFSGCAGKKRPPQKTADAVDSILKATDVTDEEADSIFFLTADSIGPIHVGEEMSLLPVAVPNLFDNMLVTETPDAVAYSFLLADMPQFTIYDFLNGKVDIIALEANSLGVQTPDGVLKVGDEFTRVLALPGAYAEWESLDDGGIWYWRYEGLFFGVDEMEISEALGDALCDDHNPPRAALFTPGVKIGYIATGLPF